MRFTSITQRFVLWFLLISLLPILLLGYGLLHTFEKELQLTVSQQISAIADKKVDQIDTYLDERLNDALIKAQSDTTRFAVNAFTQSFNHDGVKSDAYHRLDARYRDYFKRYVTSAGYYDLFLISPQGTVVYSQTHESDFATNLLTGPYRNSGLAKVTRNALNTLEGSVSEFELYAPSNNAIAAFLAVPIMNQGKVEGVLAIQIDNVRIFGVLLDKTGLGNSGETIVARLEDEHTALVMAPLRDEPDAALKRRILLSDSKHIVPLAHALNGERGSGFGIDYNGQPVVAAWRYLPIMRAGMLVKMDTAEALAPLYHVRTFGLAALGLALLAALTGAILLGRRVVIPLKTLHRSAQDIAAGKLDQRVPVVGQDELGKLADSFNTMTERLNASYSELEQKVEQRTVELQNTNKELLSEMYERQLADEALRQSNERFHTIIEAAPNALLLVNAAGRITFLNSQAERIFGYPREELLGKSIEMLIPPEFRQDHPHKRAAYSGSPTTRDMGVGRDIFGLRKDGTTVPVEIGLNPINMQEGQHILASIIDITERKRAEHALKHLNEELEQRVEQRTALLLAAKEEAERANQAKSEFLSRMSHELRTPMNAILGFSQILETDTQTPLSPDQHESVKEILHAGNHLLELINEVLDLARIESGRIDLSLEPVEVAPLLEECVTLLQPLANEHQITLAADLSNHVRVQADHIRLRQIILNLLSNAIKYNREAGRVDIHCNASGADRVRIAFHDTGRGIPPESLQLLFKPFERMESAYDAIEGTGIGLAISKRLTDAMNGTIGVESEAGKGSIFWVEFPLAASEPSLPESVAEMKRTQFNRTDAHTLLYIEDNPANLRLVQKIIATHTDLLLLDAASAELGLEIAASQKPDIILLDINLPGMGGFEALQHLKENPVTRAIPVIAITANAMPKDVAQGIAAGFTDYLTKPLEIPRLLALLDSLLNQRQTSTTAPIQSDR